VVRDLLAKPPPQGAPKLDRLLWLRWNYFRVLVLYVPLFAVAAVAGGAGLFVMCACVAVTLVGLSILLVQISRERKRKRPA
jgi:hypothetical protein